MSREKKELGYALKVSEVQRVKKAVAKLGRLLEDAAAESKNLQEAYERLAENDKTGITGIGYELYRLSNSGTWMNVLLGGTTANTEFIQSILNRIITLIALGKANIKED